MAIKVNREENIISVNDYKITAMTVKEAQRVIRQIVESYIGEPTRFYNHGKELELNLAIDYEIGWGVSCTLYVRQDWGDDKVMEKLRELNTDRTKEVRPLILDLELSWSCTGRSIPQATSAINLYTKFRDMASDIEAALSSEAYIVGYYTQKETENE